MNDLSAFLVMLLSFTGAAVTIIWVIVFAIGRLKRLAARPGPGQLSPEELEDIRTRLVDLEQRDARVEEIEERLDFVERALGRPRDVKPALPHPPDQA